MQQIYESTALIDWTFDSTDVLSAAELYSIERETSTYFHTLMDAASVYETFLSLQVETTASAVRDDTRIDGRVTMSYINHLPVQLDTVLSSLGQQDQFYGLQQKLGPVEVSLRPDTPTIVLEAVRLDTGRTAADKGLVLAVAFMVVVLVLVSSVLLYVTGGWRACRVRCMHCLFEEVEEDDYQVQKQATFQVQSYDEEDAQDDASTNTGMATNPDGVLGVNPAAGLGIKTPSRPVMDGDGKLGIQSLRKMPQADDSSGLSSIFGRWGR